MCADAAAIGQSLRKVRESIDRARSDVVTCAEAALREGLEAVLRTSPIEDLEKLGARTSALRAGGVSTVYDLEGRSEWQIEQLRGIGEVTARKVMAARDQLKSAIRVELSAIPDISAPRESDGALLAAVLRYQSLSRNLPDRLQELEARLLALESRLSGLKDSSGLLRLLFSTAQRSKFDSSHGNLQRGVADELKWLKHGTEALKSFEGGLRYDPVEARRQYEQNSASFVAILESILPATFVDSSFSTHKEPSLYGGVPSDIAREVESVSLNRGPLRATLRRYQQFGAQYVVSRRRSLLGDEMGLGKTVQVLAAVSHLHAGGASRFLVVCPNSVLINWQREVAKHTVLRHVLIHGTGREDELADWLRDGGVGITTFSTLSKLTHLIGKIDLLAVDEAHAVKNPDTQRNQSVALLASRASYLVLMTGTALENRLSEMHTLVSMAQPDLKELLQKLLANVRPNPVKVRSQLASVYLRRTQGDVLHELPDQVHSDEFVHLDTADFLAYQMTPKNLMKRRLAATTGQGNLSSAKYERLRELLESHEEEGRKVVVFSTFLQVLSDVSVIASGCPIIHGGVTPLRRQEIIDTFSSLQGFAVLALQIDAGGLGINLQAAQVVILMEPQFKPSTEWQAVARVRRMGQVHKVLSHRLIAEGTVDEALVKLIEEKELIFEDYAHQSDVKLASRMAVDGTSGQLYEEIKSALR